MTCTDNKKYKVRRGHQYNTAKQYEPVSIWELKTFEETKITKPAKSIRIHTTLSNEGNDKIGSSSIYMFKFFTKKRTEKLEEIVIIMNPIGLEPQDCLNL